jgi:hypothetical protein
MESLAKPQCFFIKFWGTIRERYNYATSLLTAIKFPVAGDHIHG